MSRGPGRAAEAAGTGALREVARGAVGIFGGTFNPIHIGHLRAAEEVAEGLDLAELRFVPALHPPHKEGPSEAEIAPADERLAWLELAIRDNPRFRADPREIRRGGRSYTVDTLRELEGELGAGRAVFVIGGDALSELDTWRSPEEILALAHFAVMARPGPAGRIRDLRRLLPESLREEFALAPDGRTGTHRRAGTRIGIVEVTPLDVSASAIRARLRGGLSIRYLLPEVVRRAVLESGAYGVRPAQAAEEVS